MKIWWVIIGISVGGLLLIGALRPRPVISNDRAAGESNAFREQASPAAILPAEPMPTPAARFSPSDVRQFGSATDIATMAAYLDAIPESDEQRDLARAWLTKLFETNAVSATELIAALHEPLNIQMAATLASIWSEKDIRSAAEWATRLPASLTRTHALLSLCADWASTEPQIAAEYVLNSSAADFPTGAANSDSSQSVEIRSQMLETIGNRWAATDANSATQWVKKLPVGTERDAIVAGITSALADTSPVEAAKLVASMSTGPRQNDAALTVLLQWERTDPQAAADWLKLFPAGEFRDKALLNLTGILAEQGPETADKIVLEWPDPAERTKAIRYFLNETLGSDASRGAEMVMGIEDDSLFQEETLRVAQHWIVQYPRIALQWADQVGLDEITRARLMATPGLSPAPF